MRGDKRAKSVKMDIIDKKAISLFEVMKHTKFGLFL